MVKNTINLVVVLRHIANKQKETRQLTQITVARLLGVLPEDAQAKATLDLVGSHLVAKVKRKGHFNCQGRPMPRTAYPQSGSRQRAMIALKEIA